MQSVKLYGSCLIDLIEDRRLKCRLLLYDLSSQNRIEGLKVFRQASDCRGSESNTKRLSVERKENCYSFMQ